MTALRWGAATDVGRRRTTQQDMILASEPLFAVADGMGGHAGGEIASLTAVEALKAASAAVRDPDSLEDAVQEANRAVQERASRDPNLRSMGTTLAVAALVPDETEGDVFVVANVGDSRIYLLRDSELSQLTDDHSVPQELYRAGQLTEAEAAADPRKNMITRVIGMPEVEPDLQTLVPYVGDRLLLCSDGLTNEVGHDDIRGVLLRVDDPDEAARTLVDMANANGGNDNISVLIVDVVDDDDRAAAASTALRSEPSRLMTADQRNSQLRSLAREDERAPTPGRPDGRGGQQRAAADDPVTHEPPHRRVTGRVVLFVLVLFLLLGGAAAAVGWYARGSYYVGLEESRVVIFKGRPGGLLWFNPTAEVRTPLTESDVLPARLDDLRAGKEEPSLEEARRYVRNLEDEAAARRASGQAGSEDPNATTSTTAPADPTATTAPPP